MHFCLAREYEILAEVHFRLTGEIRGFAKEYSLLEKIGFKQKFHLSKTSHIPEKNAVFLLSKVFGIFKTFFQKGLKWGLGQRPIKKKRGAPPHEKKGKGILNIFPAAE